MNDYTVRCDRGELAAGEDIDCGASRQFLNRGQATEKIAERTRKKYTQASTFVQL